MRQLLVFLLAVISFGFGTDPPMPAPKSPRPGMSMAEVQTLLGRPQRVTRQVLYQRFFEQWHYGRHGISWVEFEYRPGQEPRLQTVHPTEPAKS